MGFRRHLIGSLATAAILAPVMVHADAPAPKWYDKVALGGYTSVYYQADLNRPADNGTPNSYRVFDNTRNQFSLQTAELTLKANDDASKTGYFLDLLLGSSAGIYNSANTANQILGQAYLTQAFGSATFTLGKFATPIGTEVAYTPSNANFSRGLLYSKEPYYNLGLKLDYALPAGFTASAWVDDSSSVDNASNAGKGYGAILAYAGIKNLSLSAIYYLTPNAPAANGQLSNSHLIDVLGSYTVSDALSFSGEYLYTTSIDPNNANFSGAKAQGYALYSTYTIANVSISPRFEQWITPDATALAAPATATYELTDYTLTAKYPMGPLTHQLEYRCDASNAAEFTVAGSTTKSQIDETITYAATYSF